MKNYVQFQILSTGYINESIPPKFDDKNKYPIDLIGSDGICYLDGRFNLSSKINLAHEIWAKHISKNIIIGFEIKQNDKVLYRYLQPGYLDNFSKKKEI